MPACFSIVVAGILFSSWVSTSVGCFRLLEKSDSFIQLPLFFLKFVNFVIQLTLPSVRCVDCRCVVAQCLFLVTGTPGLAAMIVFLDRYRTQYLDHSDFFFWIQRLRVRLSLVVAGIAGLFKNSNFFMRASWWRKQHMAPTNAGCICCIRFVWIKCQVRLQSSSINTISGLSQNLGSKASCRGKKHQALGRGGGGRIVG